MSNLFFKKKNKYRKNKLDLSNKNKNIVKIKKGICDYNKLKKLTILIKDLKYKN